ILFKLIPFIEGIGVDGVEKEIIEEGIGNNTISIANSVTIFKSTNRRRLIIIIILLIRSLLTEIGI
ncbi:hypothetical protein OFB78_31000, partial [Escherichia coli]|nr:hypothetical protein [Escherichia coli]